MFNIKRRFTCKVISLFLVIFFVFQTPVLANAAEPIQPRASDYLSVYSAYVYVTPAGEVQIWFDVMGTGDMDEIGALSIRLYESSDGTNWTRVETFLHEDCDTMLFYDDWYISSHVSYPNGSTTKQYKAYVGIWAGKNGDGDTRYFWAYQPHL